MVRRSLKLWGFGTIAAVAALCGGGAARAADEARTAPPPPTWPERPRPAPNAPNVLVIITDDVGFGATSAFGGPVPTPTLDTLARQGLRFNSFHNTAICSPTRAALLTGRNAHNVGMANVENLATGYDGYNSVIPRSAASLPRVLAGAGYATAMFGKAHFVAQWEQSQAGPFDRWPTGLGFQHYYGFIAGDTNQYAPALFEGTTPVEAPRTPGYILDKDLADHAIAWLRDHNALAPDQPFFLYYATGTAHAPHQAPAEWIGKFRGRFDRGWDAMRQETFARQKALGIVPQTAKLTKRPAVVPGWANLSADQRKVANRLMEAYAGALAYSDAQIGRVIDALRASGKIDNTLIVFVEGDNGASAEGGPGGTLYEQSWINRAPEPVAFQLSQLDEIGGPKTYSNYPVGWAWAMNTPFKFYKQTSHLGGNRTGVVVSWPGHVAAPGTIETQFHHVIDIAPSIYQAAGVAAPEVVDGVPQKPLDGISFLNALAGGKRTSPRRTQYFEIMGNRAIYKDGWMAVTTPQNRPWGALDPIDFDRQKWELYDLAVDFSEATDLAASNPAKLADLQTTFVGEAAKYQVLPLHLPNQGAEGRPTVSAPRNRYVYPSGVSRVPESVAPNIKNRSFDVTADLEIGRDAHGMIVTQGGRFGGWALFLKNGRPVFHYNAIRPRQYRIASDAPIGVGRHTLRASFAYDGGQPGAGGTLTLFVDGRRVQEGRIDATLPVIISINEGLDVGRDSGTPVADDYQTPFVLDGVKAVAVELK